MTYLEAVAEAKEELDDFAKTHDATFRSSFNETVCQTEVTVNQKIRAKTGIIYSVAISLPYE